MFKFYFIFFPLGVNRYAHCEKKLPRFLSFVITARQPMLSRPIISPDYNTCSLTDGCGLMVDQYDSDMCELFIYY